MAGYLRVPAGLFPTGGGADGFRGRCICAGFSGGGRLVAHPSGWTRSARHPVAHPSGWPLLTLTFPIRVCAALRSGARYPRFRNWILILLPFGPRPGFVLPYGQELAALGRYQNNQQDFSLTLCIQSNELGYGLTLCFSYCCSVIKTIELCVMCKEVSRS